MMKTWVSALFLGLALQASSASAATTHADNGMFVAGESTFLWVPDAQIIDMKIASPPNTSSRSTLANLARQGEPEVDARIGNFGIVLAAPSAQKGRRILATVAASRDKTDLAVAINERSGQLVLVPARIKVFGIQPAKAAELAKQSGGELTYASPFDQVAYVKFSTLDAAKAALELFANSQGVEEASFDVIQSTNTPN